MRRTFRAPVRVLTAAVLAAVLATACDDAPGSPELSSTALTGPSMAKGGPGAVQVGTSFEFTGGPVYDIEALPNGNILVPVSVSAGLNPGGGTVTTTIREIRTGGVGGVGDYATVSTPAAATAGTGVPINGVASVGSGQLYATRGGLDLAVGAGVVQVTPSGERLVADIHAFEVANDPDAAVWKVPACEGTPPFSAGPQSNPYHIDAESGNTMIVGDAAGNQVLRVKGTGEIQLVAVVTPPVNGGGASTDPADWMVLFPLDAETDCYVQPVPNSVAVGPDGAIYVGELTGAGPAGPVIGASRVWRIAPGAANTVCPSADCTMILDGFTSIIDLDVGPDGDLYVVEFDENSWLAVVTPPPPAGIPTAGGTVDRCDLEMLSCTEEWTGLTTPASVTFDRSGAMWLLENNLAAPTVTRVQ